LLTLSTFIGDTRLVALKTRTPKSYHHGDLRNALLETSLQLIEEKGVRALTLREIGSRVGVSRTAAYRHFTDKGNLLAAICETGFHRFVEVLTAARESAGDTFPARLSQMGLAYVRFAAEHPAHYEVMFGSGPDPADEHWRKSGARAFELLVETIREGQASGDVAAGDSIELASIVWSTVHGISMLRLHTDFSNGSAGADSVLLAGRILAAGLRDWSTPPSTGRKSKRGK
jgi:AcrR family transcriptional regulator